MDPQFMHRCFVLASLGRGKVGNGALVGSVLVRDGTIIAEGHHEAFGKAHAERMLLEKFSGDILPTDTLYVNLEPCCHTGKTPPCTDIILERGVKRVVFGMLDPDTRVAGNGIELLRKNGVEVLGPCERALCEKMNRGFITVRTKNRPWITLKSARRSDGKIANDDGSPLKITSGEQDEWSHTFLRSQLDAIVIGIGTALADNPSLTPRFASDKPSILNTKIDQYQPYRVVFDAQLRMPAESKLLTDEWKEKTILICSSGIDEEKKHIFQSRGVKIFSVSTTNGFFVWEELWKALTSPSENFSGITSVLVEGGAKTWEVFKKNKMMDEEICLIGA